MRERRERHARGEGSTCTMLHEAGPHSFDTRATYLPNIVRSKDHEAMSASCYQINAILPSATSHASIKSSSQSKNTPGS